MNFNNNIDVWKNEGAEPDSTRKEKGFEGGYYPPAGIFNWLFHNHSAAIVELQEILQSLNADSIEAADNLLSNLPNAIKASGNLLYRGTINASNAKNADTYTDIGIYKVYLDGVSGSDFNFPTPYGIFVVSAAMDGTSYDYVAQAFYSMGDNKFFTRTSSDNGATWLDWRQAAAQTDLLTHTSNKKNPHNVTCSQIGAVPMENALAAGTDLDTVVKSGMYRINESPVNAPADIAYGQLLVVHGGNDTVAQIAFPYNQSRMFFRTGNPTSAGGTGAWKDWTQVYTSFNKPTPAEIGAVSNTFGYGTTAKDISMTDLVDTLKAGKSGLYTGADVTNAPTTDWWIFEVISHSTVHATVIAYSIWNNYVYRGALVNGSFSGWIEVYTSVSVPNAAKIETISYSGTNSDGAYLTFSKLPKTIIITGINDNDSIDIVWGIANVQNGIVFPAYNNDGGFFVSLQTHGTNITVGKSTSFTNGSEYNILNCSGYTYTCTALY